MTDYISEQEKIERMTMTDKERKEDAADIAVHRAIDNLVRQHEPKYFMLSLGVRFAMGLDYIFPEERDNVLDAFFWRIHKYTGIIIERKK